MTTLVARSFKHLLQKRGTPTSATSNKLVDDGESSIACATAAGFKVRRVAQMNDEEDKSAAGTAETGQYTVYFGRLLKLRVVSAVVLCQGHYSAGGLV
jgi:hypothetical protein